MNGRSEVVEAVVEVCGTETEALVDDATLESLGIDSLDLIEIAMIVETKFDIHVEGEDFEGVTTFGGALAVFQRLIAAAEG